MSAAQDICEAIWKLLVTGMPLHRVEQDREQDGSYIKGFRNDYEVWARSIGDLTLRAISTKWQTFNLGEDGEGSRRKIEVRRGDDLLFQAEQEGASQHIKFSGGTEERYASTEARNAQPWRVVNGNLALVASLSCR